MVAIGEAVVEREVKGHRSEHRAALGDGEAEAERAEQKVKQTEVDADTDHADRAELDQLDRDEAADGLVEQQFEIFERDHLVELAGARGADAEV